MLACAGFGAICGSSIATAATMSKVAYPSMKKLGYADYLSTGVIAAGGTLGIMIPPSTIMVIYGIVTETHIGKLFAAGVLPGLLCAALMMLAVAFITGRDPQAGPAGERSTWRERLAALRDIWGVALLVVVVLGGIYGGVFTATEGAGIGASGAFFFALARRALTWRMLLDVLVESARTTAMLFTILIAAMMFSGFVNFTTMPGDLKDWITHAGPAAAGGGRRDDADLRGARHHHGRAVDGAADDPGVLPDRHAARLRPGVVRRADRAGGADRADLAAGRHEPVRAELAAQGRAAEADLSRRVALRRRADRRRWRSCWSFSPWRCGCRAS